MRVITKIFSAIGRLFRRTDVKQSDRKARAELRAAQERSRKLEEELSALPD